jgi:hypothetical protein
LGIEHPARGLLQDKPVSELIQTTRQHLELNETVRMAVLTMFTVVLAVAFLALLVSDQVQAAGIAAGL